MQDFSGFMLYLSWTFLLIQKLKKTALHLACDECHEPVIRVLLENSADPNLQMLVSNFRQMCLTYLCMRLHTYTHVYTCTV